MKETEFIEINRDNWSTLEQESKKNRLNNPDDLFDMYANTTEDLSYSGTFYGNRSVRVFLNTLGQKFYYAIYSNINPSLKDSFSFLKNDLPSMLWEIRWTMWTGFLIFWIATLIGFVGSYLYPQLPEMVLGDYYINETIANINNGDPMAIYKSQRSFSMFREIGLNNMMVSLVLFLGGLFMGIGTIGMSVFNGIMLGTFQYLFIKYSEGNHLESMPFLIGFITFLSIVISVLSVSKNYDFSKGKYNRTAQKNKIWEIMILAMPIVIVISFFFGLYILGGSVLKQSITTIWIHGTLEIACISIATGAGLEFAKGELFPSTYTRMQSLQRSGKKAVFIFLSITPIIAMAAYLESYQTRNTEDPEIFRLLIIVLSLAFILGYYVVLPCYKAYSNNLVVLETEKLKDSYLKTLDFNTIKSNKTILDEVIQIVGKNSTKLIKYILVSSVAYIICLILIQNTDFLYNLKPDEALTYFNYDDYNEDSISENFYKYLSGSILLFQKTNILLILLNFFLNFSLLTTVLHIIYSEKTALELQENVFKFLKRKQQLIPIISGAILLTVIPILFPLKNFEELIIFFISGFFALQLITALNEEENLIDAFKYGFKAIPTGFMKFIGLQILVAIFNTVLIFFVVVIINLALTAVVSNVSRVLDIAIKINTLVQLLSYQSMLIICFITSYLFYTSNKESVFAFKLIEQINNIKGKKQIKGVDVENII